MNRTILIVDDSEAIRYLLETTFRKHYRVSVAADACSARHQLVEYQLPDLIIANSSLPDAPRWEFIDYLRSSAFYRTIPMIVLSDDTRESTALKCEMLDIAHFFVKPFNPELLSAAAAELIGSGTKAKNFFRFVS